MHKPSVIFLDEPTIGLGVIAKQRIRDLLTQLHTEEGVTVFLTSHDAGDIEQICRRAIVINHGEIILDAPVAKLKREYLKAKGHGLKLEIRPVILSAAKDLARWTTDPAALRMTGGTSLQPAHGYTYLQMSDIRTGIRLL